MVSDHIPLTAFAEPTDDLEYKDLSKSQQRAYDVVEENKQLYDETKATLKHGVLIVGAWGAGKSQVLRVMRNEGLVEDILERGQIYSGIVEDIELKNEETIRKLLNNIINQARKAESPFIALDNPDIPVGSNVTENAAYRFTWRLLEEATFGRLPYLVVTLNEFTFRKFIDERKHSIGKIAQHFDIIFLEWDAEDLAMAIRARLPPNYYQTRKQRELLEEAAKVARTPRSALFLFIQAVCDKRSPTDLIVDYGIKEAFNEYIRILSQSGYKLSKASSARWVKVWREIIENRKYRELVKGLIDRKGVATKKLYDVLSKDYKVSHWPITAATRYHIIEKVTTSDHPGYRFTDEFLAASADYAAGLAPTPRSLKGSTTSGILESMAELYGKIGR